MLMTLWEGSSEQREVSRADSPSRNKATRLTATIRLNEDIRESGHHRIHPEALNRMDE
jgi:hypothetical protein